MTSPQAPPPSDLVPRGRGRRFWRGVTGAYDLRPDELELLAEACRQLDLLEALRSAATSVLLGERVHPALVEARQVRQELRRTLAQLCLPDDSEEDAVTLEMANARSWRARKAARARWSHGA
jgi:hypothetical protein